MSMIYASVQRFVAFNSSNLQLETSKTLPLMSRETFWDTVSARLRLFSKDICNQVRSYLCQVVLWLHPNKMRSIYPQQKILHKIC